MENEKLISNKVINDTMTYNYAEMNPCKSAIRSVHAATKSWSSATLSLTVTMSAFGSAEKCWSVTEKSLCVAEESLNAAKHSGNVSEDSLSDANRPYSIKQEIEMSAQSLSI